MVTTWPRAEDRAGSTPFLVNDASMATALAALRLADPLVMPSLIERIGHPALRLRPAGFAGLAAIVVAQQVSTASAAAIFGRLESALTPLDAASMMAASDAVLQGCGLSRGKIKTLRIIACAVADGSLSLPGLACGAAADARSRLIAIPGIGPWTADVFMLFCLGYPDAWPAGDLALQEGARLLLGLSTRPTMQEMSAIGARWQPNRGAAAYLLWAFYRLSRSRDGQPLDVVSDTPP